MFENIDIVRFYLIFVNLFVENLSYFCISCKYTCLICNLYWYFCHVHFGALCHLQYFAICVMFFRRSPDKVSVCAALPALAATSLHKILSIPPLFWRIYQYGKLGETKHKILILYAKKFPLKYEEKTIFFHKTNAESFMKVGYLTNFYTSWSGHCFWKKTKI